ncbi:MAG TPA: hypothetical protein VMJ93_16205 [Verrucomicrobiae bacterium]|nr:hypothetical protein [Verrucomicrobiae bacterium]
MRLKREASANLPGEQYDAPMARVKRGFEEERGESRRGGEEKRRRAGGVQYD